jgi:hypothetical protein
MQKAEGGSILHFSFVICYLPFANFLFATCYLLFCYFANLRFVNFLLPFFITIFHFSLFVIWKAVPLSRGAFGNEKWQDGK